MRTALLVAAGLLMSGVVPSTTRGVPAATSAGYEMTWSSLDCGSSVTSAAGGYQLAGTIGQAEAGKLTGGRYTLESGFHRSSLTPTDARDDDTEANALVFRLHGNVPNPFATSTAIAFSLAQESEVRLHIYDLSGRLVRELVARQLGPGRHHVNWDGDDALGHRVAQGIYFMRLQAGAFETSKKLVLLR